MDQARREDWHKDPNSLRGTRIVIEPAPEWVTRRTVKGAPRAEAQPVTVLLLDRQIHPDLMMRHTRYVRRLETPQAVQEAGRIEVDFDPATQKLSIHGISIFREGNLSNLANLEDIKIIQRERGLEQGIYDGSITALILLNDLRTGDVIDVETTITSDDAVFPNHYWFIENLEHAMPVSRQYFAWVSRHQDKFRIEDSGSGIVPTGEDTPFGIRKTWENVEPKVIEIPPMLPDGYIPFKNLCITSFHSWEEVAEEMHRTWRRTENPGEKLAAELVVLQESHAAGSHGLAQAIVEFVRDRVRYQALSIGRLGMVPDELCAVWDRRYGDCKEKTSMLCWMLRECGFEATPALVSTQLRGRVSGFLPAPVFDHVVVHLALDDVDYWIDPTDISRRGVLADWTSLPFQKALPISANAGGFLTIPAPPPGRNILTVLEEYRFPGNGSDAELTVEHRYRGTEADQARHALDSHGRVAVQQIFANMVKSTRSQAELATDMEVADDPVGNEITLRATFHAPEMLKRNPGAANLITELVPHSLVQRLTGMDDRKRVHPLGIAHPVEVRHSTILHHPDSKGAVVPKVMIDNEYIKFSAGTENGGELPILRYYYLTKAPEIPVKDLARYRTHLRQIGDVVSLTFQTRGISQGARSQTSPRLSWEEEELGPNVPRQRTSHNRGGPGAGSSVPYWLIGVAIFILIKLVLLMMSSM